MKEILNFLREIIFVEQISALLIKKLETGKQSKLRKHVRLERMGLFVTLTAQKLENCMFEFGFETYTSGPRHFRFHVSNNVSAMVVPM